MIINEIIRKAKHRHINPSYIDRGYPTRRTKMFFRLLIANRKLFYLNPSKIIVPKKSSGFA